MPTPIFSLYNHEHFRMPKDVILFIFQHSKTLLIQLNTSQNAIWHSILWWSIAKVVIWTTCCVAARDSWCQRKKSCATLYKLLLLWATFTANQLCIEIWRRITCFSPLLAFSRCHCWPLQTILQNILHYTQSHSCGAWCSKQLLQLSWHIHILCYITNGKNCSVAELIVWTLLLHTLVCSLETLASAKIWDSKLTRWGGPWLGLHSTWALSSCRKFPTSDIIQTFTCPLRI